MHFGTLQEIRKLTKKEKILIGAASTLVVGGLLFLFRKQISAGLKTVFKGYQWFETSLNWYRDKHNRKEVERLHPLYRDDIKELFSWIEKNTDWDVIVTSGYRTFEKQAQLYRENSKNAPAGKSSHNYGFAVDINLRNRKTGQQLKKASSKSSWEATGIPQQAKKMGFKWGVDFKNYHDPIHFSKAGVPSTSKMLSMHNAGQVDSKGYVKLVA